MEESVAAFLSVILPQIRSECNLGGESSSVMTLRILADIDSKKTTPGKIIANAVSDLIAEIKSDLKMEISMMIRMELDDLRSERANDNVIKRQTGWFSTAMTKKTDRVSNDRAINDTCPDDKLLKNPLFQMVSKTISRTEQGLAAYTAEEYADARGIRFDDENREMFLNTAKNYKPANFTKEVDSDDSSGEDDRWEKAMNSRKNQ